MNITRTTNEGNREYQLLDQNFTKVNEEKDIVVTKDSLLSFEQHICEKVIRANSVFAAIRRTFKYLNDETFLPIYKTLVSKYIKLNSKQVRGDTSRIYAIGGTFILIAQDSLSFLAPVFV
jgi:hypothetical protein